MKKLNPGLSLLLISSILFQFTSCKNPSAGKNTQEDSKQIVSPVKTIHSAGTEATGENIQLITERLDSDTANILHNIYQIPEVNVSASPDGLQQMTFSAGTEILDYDVSPEGPVVSAIFKNKNGNEYIGFWIIGENHLADSVPLDPAMDARAITWHPQGNALFIMGIAGGKYQISRIEKHQNAWKQFPIYSTSEKIRRLLVCPRPFITDYNIETGGESYHYRIFFGLRNDNNSYRIVSITENGKRFYQVVGPEETRTRATDLDTDIDPSENYADWALPMAFHPAGHQLIWQDKEHNYHVASYSRSFYRSEPFQANINQSGTITPTPNGLGMIHWEKNKPGIGIYLFPGHHEGRQLQNYYFLWTPSSVPDGKGIVGLTKSEQQYTLHYLPIEVPMASVTNAWMFVHSKNEASLFEQYAGLFRPNEGEQLYSLYETENYYCGGYDRNAPTRPYLVTTDIFWELYGIAYEGLFIVKEKYTAIPAFRNFIEKTESYLKTQQSGSPWLPVFTTLTDLFNDNADNPEVAKILKQQDDISTVTIEDFGYSDLKPRGHYTSSPELKKYFMAFRYFTNIYQNSKSNLLMLDQLPEDIKKYAEEWINSYAGFIAPSRSPLVWKDLQQQPPAYCLYPKNNKTVFPLSWGFDNEILWSCVYHPDVPEDLQVTGKNGSRLLPSGLDIAAVLGNSFAEDLLKPDFEAYPPLRKVINNLRNNFKANKDKAVFKNNLYNQWITALAVQWADSVTASVQDSGKKLWQAKRLQTGLASWATLRHATILVNERGAAECGEGGFEEILMRAPRGYVEPDPATFATVAKLFDNAVQFIENDPSDDEALKDMKTGIIDKLKEGAAQTRIFQAMAEKERRGENLTSDEYNQILHVSGPAEHLFLIYSSLASKDYGLSNPDPMAKIADVFGNSNTGFLMSAVGNTMEWDYIVPFYGRKQVVKGAIYSYYEFKSDKIYNDKEWREDVTSQDFPSWINPFITLKNASGIAKTSY
jgi:hypothetical protein